MISARKRANSLHQHEKHEPGRNEVGEGETFFEGEISPQQERLVCVGGNGVVGFVVGGLSLRVNQLVEQLVN